MSSRENEGANGRRNAIASGRKLRPQGKRTDDGQRGKSSVLPYRRSHAQPVESPFWLQGLRDMAEAAESELRVDGGGELLDEAADPSG